MIVGCLSIPSCCNFLIISINEYHRCSFCCQSSVPLALINFFSLNTCYSSCWLWVVTTARSHWLTHC
jgi:hypothetical protein